MKKMDVFALAQDALQSTGNSYYIDHLFEKGSYALYPTTIMSHRWTTVLIINTQLIAVMMTREVLGSCVDL